MASNFSAYLSIYNDWDILEPALKSIAPYIDELVVVDGGYKWMAPYADRTGRSLLLSDDRVYSAIEACGIRYRIVTQSWDNEVQKRMAGYDACNTRYVFRVDADEILHFNEHALEQYFSLGEAVGEMEMPTYMAPGWILANNDQTRIGRQSFLFDKKQINTTEHLAYLWLVLEADSLPSNAQRQIPVFSESLAYNAHLTTWRTPTTARNRAVFYVMNYFRAKGVPWLADMQHPVSDFRRFFDVVPPPVFENILVGHTLVSGHFEPKANSCLIRSPLSDEQEAAFAPLYDRFLHGNARLNRQLRSIWRDFVTGQFTSVDLSSSYALKALTDDGTIRLQFDKPLHAAKIQMRYMLQHAPWFGLSELPCRIDGNILEVAVPDLFSGTLRRTLEFAVWMGDNSRVHRYATVYAPSDLSDDIIKI